MTRTPPTDHGGVPERESLFASGGSLLVVVALIASGCGGDDSANPCVGTITKEYTEQDASVGVVVGGNKNGGGVVVPVGGGTRYYLRLRRDDGSMCSRKVKKATYLNKSVGERYDYTAKAKS